MRSHDIEVAQRVVESPLGTAGLFVSEEGNTLGGWFRTHDSEGEKCAYTTFRVLEFLPETLTEADSVDLHLDGASNAFEITREGVVTIDLHGDISSILDQLNERDSSRVFLTGNTASNCSDFGLTMFKEGQWWGSECGPDITVEEDPSRRESPDDLFSVMSIPSGTAATIVSGTVPASGLDQG